MSFGKNLLVLKFVNLKRKLYNRLFGESSIRRIGIRRIGVDPFNEQIQIKSNVKIDRILCHLFVSIEGQNIIQYFCFDVHVKLREK